MYYSPTRRNLKRFSIAFSMKETSRYRPPRGLFSYPVSQSDTLAWHRWVIQSPTSSAASSSLSYSECNRSTPIATKYLLINTIATRKALWSRLLSGLLLAVQIRQLKNLQLLEIIFSYFNALCRGKSLNLHLCKMYEREVCFLRWSQLGSPKSSKIRSETDPCIIKAQVARYQYYKDSASENDVLKRKAKKEKI